jgi:GMP synthase PP-ATPase subunit
MHDLGRFASRDRARMSVQLFEIRIIKGVNRVAYDVMSKPPGTIEWE